MKGRTAWKAARRAVTSPAKPVQRGDFVAAGGWRSSRVDGGFRTTAPCPKWTRFAAQSAAGLEETFHAVAAPRAVLERGSDADGRVAADPDPVPFAILRAAAAGWADIATAACEAGTTDSLTGLSPEKYLRVRLAEVYRRCRA